MKTLILGGTGLLGGALVQQCGELGHDAIVASRSSETASVDVTNRDQLAACLVLAAPDLVINCAAVTSIDACEADPGHAYRVNAWPAAELARHSEASGFKLVQVSTDHFFRGGGARRHDESAPVTLMNDYARSKYAAERFALLCPGALVIRTAFAGRSPGPRQGFADWLFGALRAGSEIALFEDAYTSLLHNGDAARVILRLAECGASGLVNVASRDAFTKADLIRGFAEKMEFAVNGRPGSVASQQVPRADSLALDPARAEGIVGETMPTLDDLLERLAEDFSEPDMATRGDRAGA